MLLAVAVAVSWLLSCLVDVVVVVVVVVVMLVFACVRSSALFWFAVLEYHVEIDCCAIIELHRRSASVRTRVQQIWQGYDGVIRQVDENRILCVCGVSMCLFVCAVAVHVL